MINIQGTSFLPSSINFLCVIMLEKELIKDSKRSEINDTLALNTKRNKNYTEKLYTKKEQ